MGPGAVPFRSICLDVDRVARRVVRGGLVAVALAATLGGAGIAWRGHRANDRWRDALHEVDRIEARLEARADVRPALWGGTTDERAQPHYDRALASVEGWGGRDDELVHRALSEDGDEVRAPRAELVAAHAEALEALHRGAHAEDATRTVDWSRGFEVPVRTLMQARALVRLGELEAALLLDEGRDLEAVGVLLDALQFAGDLTRAPVMIEEMIGLALLSPVSLRDGVADGSLLSLPEDAERRLAAGLSALDRRLGWELESLEGELVLSARGLDAALRGEADGLRELAGAWGYGPLGHAWVRRLAAEHVEAMCGALAELDRGAAAGPAALLDAIDRTCLRVDELDNPISRLVLPKLDSACRARLHSLGRFRLLAHALSPSDPPADPWLAAYLREEPVEGGKRLWLDHEAFGQLEVRVAR